jgi:hypothetical protein
MCARFDIGCAFIRVGYFMLGRCMPFATLKSNPVSE